MLSNSRISETIFIYIDGDARILSLLPILDLTASRALLRWQKCYQHVIYVTKSKIQCTEYGKFFHRRINKADT